MKKFISIILTAIIMISIFTIPASAEKLPLSIPDVHTVYCDGYTKVWIYSAEGAEIRYTSNGETPTASSKLYTGGSLKVKKNITLKLRLSKSGYKTGIYKCNVKVKSVDFKAAANSAKLYPPLLSGTSIDSYVKEAVDACTTDDMTTYEKVQACYTWLVKNVKYEKSSKALVFDWQMEGLTHPEDYLIVLQAGPAFKNNKGVCDNFAAAFMLMCRYIGLDAYYAGGECKSSSGGYTGHAWTIIEVGSKIYQFDPMLDASYAQKNELQESFKYFAREDGDTLYRNREIMDFFWFE